MARFYRTGLCGGCIVDKSEQIFVRTWSTGLSVDARIWRSDHSHVIMSRVEGSFFVSLLDLESSKTLIDKIGDLTG